MWHHAAHIQDEQPRAVAWESLQHGRTPGGAARAVHKSFNQRVPHNLVVWKAKPKFCQALELIMLYRKKEVKECMNVALWHLNGSTAGTGEQNR